jgi:hypothetical protein
MTNALVEIGLFSVTVVLGLIGYPIWAAGIMIAFSAAWWAFVHHARFGNMLKAGPLKAIGSLVVALVVVAVAHLIAYGLGSAFHGLMGLK